MLTGKQNEPVGTLKIVAPKSFGALNFADAVIAFAQSQPRITVSLILDDFTFRPFDFVEKGFDLALRASSIRDSRSHLPPRWALWIGSSALPTEYLACQGTLQTPEDLIGRPCIVHLNVSPNDRLWGFDGPRRHSSIKVEGPFLSNSRPSVRMYPQGKSVRSLVQRSGSRARHRDQTASG